MCISTRQTENKRKRLRRGSLSRIASHLPGSLILLGRWTATVHPGNSPRSSKDRSAGSRFVAIPWRQSGGTCRLPSDQTALDRPHLHLGQPR